MRQIRWQTNQVVIEWSPGFTHYQLQETSDLNQAWQNVGALTTLNSASSLVTNSAKFFRVIGSIE